MDNVFVVDIETTGLDFWRNEILTISISAVSNFVTVSEEVFKFKPERKQYYSAESEQIHGISLKEAMGFNNSKKEWNRFLDFISSFSERPLPIICHAMWFGKYFDSTFIDCQLFMRELLFEKRKFIGKPVSTITMAKSIYNYESYSLDSLCKRYSIPLDHHNAVSDRIACQKLFEIFYKNGGYDGYTDFNTVQNYTDEAKETGKKTSKTKKSNNKPSDRFTLSGRH